MKFFDWLGQPISLTQWVVLFDDDCQLAETQLDDVRISTVYIGIDHSHGIGPPLIFETMVFGGPHDHDCWRYSSEREARDGHADAVAGLLREARERTP